MRRGKNKKKISYFFTTFHLLTFKGENVMLEFFSTLITKPMVMIMHVYSQRRSLQYNVHCDPT